MTSTQTSESDLAAGDILWLLVLSEAGYESHPCTTQSELVLGRSDDADICIGDGSVSRRHAMIRIDGQTMTVRDLGSANGTRVREAWIEPDVEHGISRGEAIRLGSAVVIVQEGHPTGGLRVSSREYFVARLDEECRAAQRSRRPFAVFRVRMHEAPRDSVLLRAFGSVLRASDTIGRWSHLEVCVMARGLIAGKAGEIRARIREALAQEGVGADVGYALWPEHGTSGFQLIAAATGEHVDDSEVVFGRNMHTLLESLDRVARSDLSVLLAGETGCGKEILAERVHSHSPRAEGPFVRLNCAALAPTLLESELFGHIRGAFTGASSDKPGLLEVANGGTVFLDEIGEMPLDMQVKLLRVLEERSVRRVGDLEAREIDVRFIAATNRKLDEEVYAGRFREDLYYRLGGAQFEVPALRERTDEIIPLAELFLRKYGERTASPPPQLSMAARKVLTTYHWPGNIRELRNLIETAAVLCDGHEIEPHHLPAERLVATDARRATGKMRKFDRDDPTDVVFSAKSRIARTDILDALARNDGNQSKAAAELGIHRRTLMRKMDAMGIPRPRKGRKA